MTTGSFWPNEGDELTVLVDGRDGRAVTLRGRAGRVDAQSLLIPRASLSAAQADWLTRADQVVTVAYQKAGKLIFWRMRTEEPLPNSLYLTSVRQPAPDERRAFVRAHLRLWVKLTLADEDDLFERQCTEIDISASGFGLVMRAAPELGALLDAEIASTEHARPLRAAGVVVRREQRSNGCRIAVRFVTLNSSDEEALLQWVYHSKRDALAERLGRSKAL